MTRLMKIVRRSPQTTLVVREEMYYPGGSRDGRVSHVQHLQRYPHVRSWRRHVERVIEHTATRNMSVKIRQRFRNPGQIRSNLWQKSGSASARKRERDLNGVDHRRE